MGNCNKKHKRFADRKISDDFSTTDKFDFELEISNIRGKNLTKSNSYVVINLEEKIF